MSPKESPHSRDRKRMGTKRKCPNRMEENQRVVMAQMLGRRSS